MGKQNTHSNAVTGLSLQERLEILVDALAEIGIDAVAYPPRTATDFRPRHQRKIEARKVSQVAREVYELEGV